MPRQVDHGSRRRLIAEAVCHLADERGLEGVTLRDVAARAQVSMGAVQRCFRTKEEMLVFALGHIGERIGERVRARLLGSPAQSAGTALGHAATELSLLREEHRAEARVWLAFVAQAAVSESLAGILKANYATLHEAFTRLISEAVEGSGRADGAVRLDPHVEARTLLALADGLTAHVLIGHLTPHEAHDVLHAHLARLWE
ncbi:TetR family transcriptional regulator C-terminal domain-containing protein [Streptomyces sp. PCS3-D2]|uniref:TetR/AcrR family transcriptional regulator n=1 Tax=Streptomyces sp. PCS3-D2 TaxID=1460244 RepID=UPI000445053B|nr:TetR/AcrR family transcriptional regulator [Streptomyces sp. PCS3-D2]WKV75558.1 TetR family transcriptional regulator C-terminal domain-containing protein [Streptomyces sp. PCS3-D2]